MVHFQLSSLLAEIGLNIQEAHVFSTIDGYSLDVFVVYGFALEVLFSLIFLIFYAIHGINTNTHCLVAY